MIGHEKAWLVELVLDVSAEIQFALINDFVPIVGVPKAQRTDKAADWVEEPAEQRKKKPSPANTQIKRSRNLMVELPGSDGPCIQGQVGDRIVRIFRAVSRFDPDSPGI